MHMAQKLDRVGAHRTSETRPTGVCVGGDIRIETESVGSVTSTLNAFQMLMLGLVGGEAPEGF